MLHLKNINHTFSSKKILENVNLEFSRPGIIGLVGINGAGKTTLLEIMAGCLGPTSGQVRVLGIDLLENPSEAKKHVGYLPAQLPLYPGLTVREQLELAASIHQLLRKKSDERIKELLNAFALTSLAMHPTEHLSKGFRQRLALAQSVLHKPKVLLLDEPNDGLDPQQMQQLRQFLLAQSSKLLIIFSSHLLGELHRVCNAAFVIHQHTVSPLELETSTNSSVPESAMESAFLRKITTGSLDVASRL